MMGMTYLNRPTEEQLAAAERKKDSLEQLKLIDTTQQLVKSDTTTTIADQVAQLDDTAKIKALSADFGAFANSASGKAEDVSIKNDVFEMGRLRKKEKGKHKLYLYDVCWKRKGFFKISSKVVCFSLLTIKGKASKTNVIFVMYQMFR